MNYKMDEITKYSVKAANKKFYNTIADHYEKIDGRRSPELENWLREKLSVIRQKTRGNRLLDIGTGSGLVTRCAEGLFTLRIGIDISANMIKTAKNTMSIGLVADVDNLPFANNSFDVVTCFSVLHHLYTFEKLVLEIARVLRPGGIFYSDHDMDVIFNDRFYLPLLLYRRLRYVGSKYRRTSKEVSRELYCLAEWREEKGIDSSCLAYLLKSKGFSVNFSFHWFGLSKITNKLFGVTAQARGWAPLLSLTAIKRKS